MSYHQIRYAVDGNIAIVTLTRPRFRNAQSRVLLEELDDAFATASIDDAVKVIILTGEGEHFSAGHDLGTPEEKQDQQDRPMQAGLRGRYRRSRELYVDYNLRLRDVPKPTIAVVRGYCIFGGWMVASAMDLIFAGEDAMFLGTNFQYFSAPWDIHPRRLKEIFFESRFIDARQAHDLELVNRVYPADDVLNQAMVYARRIAENDSFQLRMIKQAINQTQDTQGFRTSIGAAHNIHMLSSTGEADPGFELNRPKTRRRPMVEQALKNYQQHQQDKNET